MQQQEDIDVQLWEYIDGTCTNADYDRISMLITNDLIWQQKFNEFSAFHSAISFSIETEQPSMRFTQNVMDTISHVQVAPAAKKYINRSIVRGIAAFFIISIVSIVTYSIGTVNWNKSGNRFLPALHFPKIDIPLTLTATIFNVIVAVNIVLLLVLLDIVLRKNKPEQSI